MSPLRPITTLLLLSLAILLTNCSRKTYSISPDFSHPLEEYRFSCQSIDSLEVRAALPQLEAEYGAYVDCPDEYRGKFLAALSFYPELKGVPIRIVQKQLPTSMAARPANFAIFRNGRRYRIYLDDITEKVTDFRKYPYSAQIGCFIHELGHVRYYETRSNVRLMYDGVNYVSRQAFRSRYEQYADHHAIAHGGGYYTYLFRRYTLYDAGISKAYRKFKSENYYTAKDLLRLHLAAVAKRGLTTCTEGLILPE